MELRDLVVKKIKHCCKTYGLLGTTVLGGLINRDKRYTQLHTAKKLQI